MSSASASAFGSKPFNLQTAMGTFNSACRNLLHSIRSSQQQPKQTNLVYTVSNEALRLIKLKKEIKQTLRELEEDSDTDGDDASLLMQQLTEINAKIRSKIKN